METKIRLLTLGMKQTDILNLLAKRGTVIDAPRLSRAISGAPQANYQKIREEIDIILNEIEERNNGRLHSEEDLQ